MPPRPRGGKAIFDHLYCAVPVLPSDVSINLRPPLLTCRTLCGLRCHAQLERKGSGIRRLFSSKKRAAKVNPHAPKVRYYQPADPTSDQPLTVTKRPHPRPHLPQ